MALGVRPRRVVRFARLIDRPGRLLGGPSVRAAFGGKPAGLPRRVVPRNCPSLGPSGVAEPAGQLRELTMPHRPLSPLSPYCLLSASSHSPLLSSQDSISESAAGSGRAPADGPHTVLSRSSPRWIGR
jgi:hypothetical protein